MDLQLWSIYHDPEPMGIAPLAGCWGRAMQDRGHRVRVITSHPHYPEPLWGRSARPRRRCYQGVEAVEVPVPTGRAGLGQRLMQEASFTLGAGLCSPSLGRADAAVYISPSFPGLASMISVSRLRRMPWILWLQDILPDGAVSTALLKSGPLIEAARRFERAAYASAGHIVVICDAFRSNLLDKGVPAEKISRIYNPATIEVAPRYSGGETPPRVVVAGNIGLSQNLANLVRAFEADQSLASLQTNLIIAGGGVAADEVRGVIRTDRVQVTGVMTQEEIASEFARASIGVVSQRPDITEFNLPSKLMNYLASGLPVVASVDPASETATLIRDSGGGWVTDNHDLGSFTARLASALTDTAAAQRASDSGLKFAEAHLRPAAVAARFEETLGGLVSPAGRTG